MFTGEKLNPASSAPSSGGSGSGQLGAVGGGASMTELIGVTDDEAAAAAALTTDFTDESLPNSTNLPTIDDDSWSTG